MNQPSINSLLLTLLQQYLITNILVKFAVCQYLSNFIPVLHFVAIMIITIKYRDHFWWKILKIVLQKNIMSQVTLLSTVICKNPCYQSNVRLSFYAPYENSIWHCQQNFQNTVKYNIVVFYVIIQNKGKVQNILYSFLLFLLIKKGENKIIT